MTYSEYNINLIKWLNLSAEEKQELTKEYKKIKTWMDYFNYSHFSNNEVFFINWTRDVIIKHKKNLYNNKYLIFNTNKPVPYLIEINSWFCGWIENNLQYGYNEYLRDYKKIKDLLPFTRLKGNLKYHDDQTGKLPSTLRSIIKIMDVINELEYRWPNKYSKFMFHFEYYIHSKEFLPFLQFLTNTEQKDFFKYFQYLKNMCYTKKGFIR